MSDTPQPTRLGTSPLPVAPGASVRTLVAGETETERKPFNAGTAGEVVGFVVASMGTQPELYANVKLEAGYALLLGFEFEILP